MGNADIVIEHLLAIRADVGTIKEDVRELKNRMVSVEASQTTMLQLLGCQADGAAQPNLSVGPSSKA